MTRAMDPEVADAIWTAIEPILPIPDDDHPLGCHKPTSPRPGLLPRDPDPAGDRKAVATTSRNPVVESSGQRLGRGTGLWQAEYLFDFRHEAPEPTDLPGY
jgi:hypothetical protein